jgi:hypothetical protein
MFKRYSSHPNDLFFGSALPANRLTLNDKAPKACLSDNAITLGVAIMKSIRLNAFIFAIASIAMLLLAAESGAAQEKALVCKGAGYEGAATGLFEGE